MQKTGERVGAILGSKEDGSIDFFGYGVYEGDFVPTEAVGFMADIAREVEHTNPRIRLDDGQVVYGCECWWGSEAEIKKILEGRTVNAVSVSEVRTKWKAESEAHP